MNNSLPSLEKDFDSKEKQISSQFLNLLQRSNRYFSGLRFVSSKSFIILICCEENFHKVAKEKSGNLISERPLKYLHNCGSIN